jgi:hypothetical protein
MDLGMFGWLGNQTNFGRLGRSKFFVGLNSTENMGGWGVRKFWEVWRFEKSGVREDEVNG